MSETCIVCLGEFGEIANPLGPADTTDAKLDDGAPLGDAGRSEEIAVAAPPKSADESVLIAHLLPCGHNLHDECLQPWVERANSCPICRQKFNQVDCSYTIGGELLLSAL
jgi:hypothetical protein